MSVSRFVAADGVAGRLFMRVRVLARARVQSPESDGVLARVLCVRVHFRFLRMH
jgi:hypothetical protein